MPQATPPVSVVIPTIDRPGLLERAVEAVFCQEYDGDVQCVVVFDHVPVRQLDIAVPPGRELVLIENSRNKGLAGGRNSGCAAATGDLIAFCDDDDVWHPRKLARQTDLLHRSPGCSAVACGIRVQGPGLDRERASRTEPVTFDHLLADRVMEVNSSTILFRRDLLAVIGEVDEDIPGGYGEDYDLLLRLASYGPIAMVPEPLATLSWNGQSVFFHRWPMIIDALRYLLAKHPSFARSRKGRARIHGQIAFALASSKRRREAWSELLTVVRLNPAEQRLLATLPVALGVVSGDRVLRFAQRWGRGV